jgi:hypothetical protein
VDVGVVKITIEIVDGYEPPWGIVDTIGATLCFALIIGSAGYAMLKCFGG